MLAQTGWKEAGVGERVKPVLWLGAVGPAEAQAAVSQGCPKVDTFARPLRYALGKNSTCQ